LNKFEKEKKVIELHSKEGKTLKEIAPIVHMSFRDISKIYSKTFQKNEKNVKNAIIAANNHYAGFGPMTEKLFAEMMNLENKVKSFPIVDYKIPFKDFSETTDNHNFKIYKQLHFKTRQADIFEFFK
jgi:hypothetical protein